MDSSDSEIEESTLTREQFDEIEERLHLRYVDIFIEVHHLIKDACEGFKLYELGHPADLEEFIKNHSSAFDMIANEVLREEELQSEEDSDED